MHNSTLPQNTILQKIRYTADDVGLWEGLLSHVRITTQIQNVLMPYMRKRIAANATFCNDTIQTNFIKTYTIILWYFCDKEPLLNVEFPALYNYLQCSQSQIVVNIAKDILRHNSEDFNKEFWECKLKPFLINRSENKPKQLDTEEASAIFDLAEVLYFTLDDYLDIIEKLPVMKISQHSLIIHNLNNDNELFSKFTASQIGRIILLMLKHYTPDTSWVLYNADELLGKITPSIERNLLKEIRKKAKQHGLSWQIKV